MRLVLHSMPDSERVQHEDYFREEHNKLSTEILQLMPDAFLNNFRILSQADANVWQNIVRYFDIWQHSSNIEARNIEARSQDENLRLVFLGVNRKILFT